MALTKEQIVELKKQLAEQIQHLPEDQKAEAQKQIDTMSPKALESMLRQQQTGQPGKPQGPQKSIFRMIINDDVPSTKIDENSKAIAVLDINPISKGHTIIIPKKEAATIKDLPSSALTLAKKLAKRISKKLKSSSVEIQTETKFGELIINLIPIYDQPLNINSKRTKGNPDKLEKLAKLLKPQKRTKIIKKTKAKSTQKEIVLKLPRRIP